LTQILGCLSDQWSNPQLKRRRESSDNVGPSVPQSQRNHQGALWEQANFSGEDLQRQIAASKLDPSALMQASCAPTSTWNILAPQMDDTRCSQPFLTIPGFDYPIAQSTDPASFLAESNLQPSPSGREVLDALHLHEPHLQAHDFVDPMSSMGIDWSDDLFKMWANVPMNFRFAFFFLFSCLPDMQ
jgi:hypothetical protein